LILAKFKGKRLEALVESIFKAKGYFTYASPAGGDSGVDILAAKGDLGFENPKICIQVKSGVAVGIDILDRLSGTMKKVKADFGLLVSWEGFKGSIKEEKKNEFFTIRLWEQKELVEEFLKHYHKLDEEIKSEIPLKQIWVIADDE
jgi:restriction system protein